MHKPGQYEDHAALSADPGRVCHSVVSVVTALLSADSWPILEAIQPDLQHQGVRIE